MRKLTVIDPAQARQARVRGMMHLAIAKACYPVSQKLAKQSEELAALRTSIEIGKALRSDGAAG